VLGNDSERSWEADMPRYRIVQDSVDRWVIVNANAEELFAVRHQ
jgi:hypothetical protein